MQLLDCFKRDNVVVNYIVPGVLIFKYGLYVFYSAIFSSDVF